MNYLYKNFCVLLFVVLLILTSCDNAFTIQTFSETDLSDVSNSGEVVQRDTLRVAYTNIGSCFNPFFFQTANEKSIVDLTHISLLSLNSDRVNDSAISASELSIEETEYGTFNYYFKLKDDLKFSDGEILDVDDVIFSLYVLLDRSYDGPFTLKTLPIKGYREYINRNSQFISGITKIDDHILKLELLYSSENYLEQLSFYIAPMHHYGNSDMYNYNNHLFGFTRGDISSVKTVNEHMGAGAYIITSFADDKICLKSNLNYYLGVPRINNIEVYSANSKEMMDGVLENKYDICEADYNMETIQYLKEHNGGNIDGEVIRAHIYDHSGYTYIGINAFNVKVGNYKDSFESKCLRKAFATLFAVYRDEVCQEYYGSATSVINYPISNTSWLSPSETDEDYEVAFSHDVNGNELYFNGMTNSQRDEAALAAAIEYLICAGFIFDNELNSFIMAPDGAKLEYTVILPKDYSTYKIFEKASLALSSIGITLSINEIDNPDILWNALDNNECEIWSAAWNTSENHELYQIYHSFNTDEHYGSSGYNDFDIADAYLDDLIMQTKSEPNPTKLKKLYLQCFDVILDWSVEIPVFQRSKVALFNLYTVNNNSLYALQRGTWYDNIHLLELNPMISGDS